MKLQILKNTTFFCLSFLVIQVFAQKELSGVVMDVDGRPLMGANIYLKGTYDGATSDSSGSFSFLSSKTDSCILLVSFIGYKKYEKCFLPGESMLNIQVQLQEDENIVNEVSITAGTFEAGDKKRSVQLNAIDIVTTANAEGDIYAALSTIPGAQKQDESGKLIVRGGESREMKTYMDGMLISSPYSSNMPDMPARGRFSPMMFNGVMFSSGGYSAEYGQALSSVLVLNSMALADEDVSSISIMNVGVGAAHTKRLKRSSYSLEGNYTNTAPYFWMAQHNVDWIKMPESFGGNIRYRLKVGETGMLKVFTQYAGSGSEMNDKHPTNGDNMHITLKNHNLFSKVSYNTKLNENWLLKSGLAYNTDFEKMGFDSSQLNGEIKSTHLRIGFINSRYEKITVRFGGEFYSMNYLQNYLSNTISVDYTALLSDNISSGFIESDLKLAKRWALRFGGRVEYSSLLERTNVAPRFALAYKPNSSGQFSAAYGKFYQQSSPEYLKYNKQLDFENAQHYIINYQYEKNKRLLRIETFWKAYGNLVKYETDGYGQYQNLSNTGSGYARGVEMFWRDKASLTHTDYWISYSFIDTERYYKDYPVMATPNYVAKHNLAIVYKRWLNKIRSQVSLSYNYKSGRPYYNPESSEYLSDRTKAYNDLSGSLSYITNVFGNFTVVYLSFSNILGFNNIYGYRYYPDSDQTGTYSAQAIKPFAKRTIILAAFISIK